jgi:predicted helicase
MNLQSYLDKLNLHYRTGFSTEHTYRGDLQSLLSSLLPEVWITNEPARIACGAPDFVLTKKEIPIGYIEAKDIGVDLNSKTLKEQFDRYRSGLNNLIITDYLDFRFYKDGLLTTSIVLGRVEDGYIISNPENFKTFNTLIENFASTISLTIKSATRLAEMMANRAKLMANVIEQSLNQDDEKNTISHLKMQMNSFKDYLIHDINNSGYADIYAQTIAYGMFAARYHDPTLPTFSRQEAATLIPKSNPFLRKLFQDIAGYDLDNRLIWIVDELVNIFLATDVADIMKTFGRSTKQEDPVVHFYETFLAAYNPALRKARGVWYTPQPVVNFMVRAVDDILKKEFNLPLGLADTSKIKFTKKHVTKATSDQRSKVKMVKTEHEVHKVQILDPATGTGTFLAEVVRHIYKKFEGQQGIWNKYVDQHLIPRLNGFELLMASYAMAHLKLDMLLTETGYKSNSDQRFRIFLTNSLEEAHPDSGTLFSSWLSEEANQANTIKSETPIMVILGNPPYAVSSTNKGSWILNLIADYKKGLKETKINLDDDYIKFIRFGQHFIDKNQDGILAFISNNSFIDGITHRQMRRNLIESFDEIYIIDLHGNAKKKELSPDGTIDQNVFDIMQGVSINLFVKKNIKRSEELGKVFHLDLFGKRFFKYKSLEANFKDLNFTKLEVEAPYYFFVPKNFSNEDQYVKGFKIDELMAIGVAGIESIRDGITIHFSKDELDVVVNDFLYLDETVISKKYNTQDSRDWKISRAKDDVEKNYQNINVYQDINYRPFDVRKTFYSGKQNGFVCNGRFNVMKHLLQPNIALIAKRGFYNYGSPLGFVTKKISDRRGWSSPGMQGAESIFPLYLYPDQTNQISIDDKRERTPNLNLEIISKISESVKLKYDAHKEIENEESFGPLDLLDYIYAFLHNPSYREKYKEFLKIDFPRVPYPTDAIAFWKLVKLGGRLRQIHLLESEELENQKTQYPEPGSSDVDKPNFKLEADEIGKVYINDTQYFSGVHQKAWEFYIGGYQPAQKWLKDRKGRALDYDDILHYQKIIAALTLTSEIMQQIDF